MRKLLVFSLLLVGLAACTPADQQYCNAMGVAGTPEYANCMTYYHQQEAAFNADRGFCDGEADMTYPRTLYDTGRQQPVFYGGGGYGGPGPGGWGRPWGGPFNGGYGGVGSVYIQPDYAHNAQVDALRMRIVGPCMDARGWNAADSWQAGRHAVSRKPARTPSKGLTPATLPWMN